MWMFDLGRMRRTSISCPEKVHSIFAHKDKIMRIGQVVEVASLKELDFKKIGVLEFDLQGAALCKISKSFSVIASIAAGSVWLLRVLYNGETLQVKRLASLCEQRCDHSLI
jgi:hypothetical protein